MENNKLGTISLICGIVGLLLSCFVVGIIPCIASIVLSIMVLRDGRLKHGTATAGLICSIIGVTFGILVIVSGASVSSNKNSESVNQGNPAIEITETETPTPIPTETQTPTVIPTDEPIPVPQDTIVEDTEPLTDEEYKNKCQSYGSSDFQNIGKEMVGKYVFLELMIQDKKKDAWGNEYWECGFKNITDIGVETYVSAPCYISDCRDESDYEIKLYDKVNAWGYVTENPLDGYNGYYRPVIEVKYVDYVGKFGE